MNFCHLLPNRRLDLHWGKLVAALLLGGWLLQANFALALSATASPTTCSSVAGIGTLNWNNPERALTQNWSSASVNNLGSLQTTRHLQCTGYNFAIPASTKIDGIVVRVMRGGSNVNMLRDAAMRLVKAGTIQSGDRATNTLYQFMDYESHGGATDLWNDLTWTPADINNAGFGAAIASINLGLASVDARVDHIEITVYYSMPPTVVSINRANFDPTSTNTAVSWSVVFSGSVTGVDASDFNLVQSGGASGASITSVANVNGTTWTVTANTGTSAGTLRLDLADNDSITSSTSGLALGGAGVNNGNFTGQTYTILVPTCASDPSVVFCDDFERSNPGSVGNGWIITPANVANCSGVAGNTGCAGIDTDISPFSTYANPRASQTRSMFTRWAAVTVDSKGIDLSTSPGARVSFWLRRGSDTFSEYPDIASSYFRVQFKDAGGNWQLLAQYPSSVSPGQVFTPTIELPPAALHSGFQLRFLQGGGGGNGISSCSAPDGAPGVIGCDYWHVDDVIVRKVAQPSFTGGFCDNFENGLGRWGIGAEGFTAAQIASGAIGDGSLGTITSQSPTHSLDLRWGYVSAATLTTDLTSVAGTNITYWLRRGVNATTNPGATESLVVEYLNSSGSWTNLKTYAGLAAVGTIYNESFAIPANAKHAKFRLRFRKLGGGGFDTSYWHIDDVCVGTPTTDLALVKTRTGMLVPGANATYVLTVTNNGPGTYSGPLQVVDTLPAALTYQAAGGTNWTCSNSNQTVTCNWSGTLASGASLPSITLTASLAGSAVGLVTNTATVSQVASDLNTDNNTASDNSAVFVPYYVLTEGPCASGTTFNQPGCMPLTWNAPPPPPGLPLWAYYAGQSKGNIYITALSALGVATPLNPTSATALSFEFGFTCHDPVTHAGVQASFSALSEELLPLCTANGATPTTWSGQSVLSFPADSPSSGPYSFSYADVGRVELFMRNAKATTQSGSSGPFVARPYSFVLSNIKQTAAPQKANPSASSVNGDTFVKAGENFSITVTATTWLDQAVAPNYGKEITPEGVMLVTGNLTTSVGMKSPPLSLAGDFGAFNNGVATGTFRWDDVGIINLTPHVKDADYLFVGDTPGSTERVGRFYPHHFSVQGTLITRSDLQTTTGSIVSGEYGLMLAATNGIMVGSPLVVLGAGNNGLPLSFIVTGLIGNTAILSPNAAASVTSAAVYKQDKFTYMDEPMLLLVRLSALNAGNFVTENYSTDTGFAKLRANELTTPQWTMVGCASASPCFGLGAINGATMPLTTRLTVQTATASSSWQKGVGDFVIPFTLSRPTTTIPDGTWGPYETLNIGVAPQDKDGVTLPDAASSDIYNRLDLDADANGVIERHLIATSKARYGRVRLLNAHGSELLDLPITLRAEYYKGATQGWQLNTDDTSTTANVTITDAGTMIPTTLTCVLDNGKPGNSGMGCATPGLSARQFKAGGVANFRGDFNLWLQAPGAGHPGAYKVYVTVPAWLQFNWTGSGQANPSGLATFGIFKSGKIIHRRELY